MNRYHRIYSAYLAKIQSLGKPWPFAGIGCTGTLIKFEYQPQAFRFELNKKAVTYRPTFKLWIKPEPEVSPRTDKGEVGVQGVPGSPENKTGALPLTFFIEVDGTKTVSEMELYRKFTRFYPEEKVMAIGKDFFTHKQNQARLRKMGLWTDRKKRESKKEHG